MKQLLTTLMVAWPALVHAQRVTLAWDPSPSPEVTTYRVYYGTNSRSYTFVTNSGLVLTQALVLPHSGRWFFAATAADAAGSESDFSNEVQWEAKPAKPVLHGETWVRLSPVIEHTTNEVDWTNFIGEASWLPATNRIELFATRRLLIEPVQRAIEP